MRFDLHLRDTLREQISTVADRMRDWEETPRLTESDCNQIRGAIQPFNHTTQVEHLSIAGVDGSGDYPCVTYGDSFVHVTVAHGTVYQANSKSGLKEVPPESEPVIHVTWMAEQSEQRRQAWDDAFAALASRSISQVIEQSDYRVLKAAATNRNTSVIQLAEQLIRPHAHDSGNIAIQLRTLGELGAALRLLETHDELDYLFVDGTFSLPMVTRRDVSLFYEHLKRLCCSEARERGVGFFALSKSHGLPAIELIEGLAQEKLSPPEATKAEHWYLRLPQQDHDAWQFPLADGRHLPPIGAVTYLIRFHRNVPVLRLDMDREYWCSHVRGESDDLTVRNEQRIFQHLDYGSHDQRCFGYPYPIKAGHDRASLTTQERVSLRKQVIDAAVARGLRRTLFRDASMATGHR